MLPSDPGPTRHTSTETEPHGRGTQHTPPSERYPGRPPEGRVVVIAPTRAACETIELGVQLTCVKTVIQREHGEKTREPGPAARASAS